MARKYRGLGAKLLEGDDAREAIIYLDSDRTMMPLQMTSKTKSKPDIADGLGSVEEAMNHFGPAEEVPLKDRTGKTQKEQFVFKKLSDFGRKGIVSQSKLLQGLQESEADHLEFQKRLRSSELKNVLANKAARKAYLSLVLNHIKEIESYEKMDPKNL